MERQQKTLPINGIFLEFPIGLSQIWFRLRQKFDKDPVETAGPGTSNNAHTHGPNFFNSNPCVWSYGGLRTATGVVIRLESGTMAKQGMRCSTALVAGRRLMRNSSVATMKNIILRKRRRREPEHRMQSLVWISSVLLCGIAYTAQATHAGHSQRIPKQAEASAPGEICACQPGSYEFTLNFTSTCTDSNVKGTPGVLDAACILTTRGNANVTDRQPEIVSAVSIIELDQESQVVAQETRVNQNLMNGDTFTYTSITLTSPDTVSGTSIPKGIQIFLSAENALGEDLVNFFAIEYDSTECSMAPILSLEQRIGWTYFVSRISFAAAPWRIMNSLSFSTLCFCYC